MSSVIIRLGACVTEIASTYITGTPEQIREKIIEAHLLVSELNYHGDEEMNSVRHQNGLQPYSPFKRPENPGDPLEPTTWPQAVEAARSESRNDSELNLSDTQNPHNPNDDFFVIKCMRYYWGGSNHKWTEHLNQSVRFPTADFAIEFIKAGLPPESHAGLSGFDVVTYSSQVAQTSKPAEPGSAELISDVRDTGGAQAFFENH